MDNLLKTILDILYPPFCLFCLTPGYTICAACFSKIRVPENNICFWCKELSLGGFTHQHCLTFFPIVGFRCAFEYDGLVKRVLLSSKHYNLAFTDLECLLKRACDADRMAIYWKESFVIVPVPSDKARFRERGFNSARMVAESLRLNSDLGVRELLLKKQAKFQASLGKADRFKNVRGAYSFNKKMGLLEGQDVLLVDDVATTGATLIECARVLKEHGAGNVFAFALARGV